MDDHIMQEPHPALAVIPEPNRLIDSPYKDVLPEDVELYQKHMVHYFDNQMNRDILLLSKEDKERFFSMLKDYADILEKILHEGIPIIDHILGKPQRDAEYRCPIIFEYEAWKSVQKTEEPVQD